MASKEFVIIVHGAYGNSRENWFPWLRDELVEYGVRAKSPDFPTPENQSVKSWIDILDENTSDNYQNLILVGHSAACPLLLRKLENVPKPIKGTFLVSSFIRDIGIPEFDSINHCFYKKKFNWGKINENSREFYVIHSDNDPYVPLKYGQEIADNLDVELTIVNNGGHLNAEAGYTEFPLLLKKILKLIISGSK